MPLTEAQIAHEREPISYTPVKRLERGPLYVRKLKVPHLIKGYSESHDEYSIIDLRGYRKGYEPRLEILGVYTPNPHDLFRVQTGRLPEYQPTTTGDKLQAEMEKIGSFQAWRILPETPVTPEEPILTPEAMQFAQNMDLINPEYSFDGSRWHSYSDTKVKTTDLIKQLKKHTATVFIRKRTLGKVIFHSVENVNGKIVVTDRSYTEEPSTLKEAPGTKESRQTSFELYNTQYSLKQLREMAKSADLSPSGLKQDLMNRLVQKGVLK